jgi:hypothetical protein
VGKGVTFPEYYWHIGWYEGLAFVAAVLVWPFVRIATEAWLAGYFGAKGLRSAATQQSRYRRWPGSPRRVASIDYVETVTDPQALPMPRAALRGRRVKQLPPPIHFNDEMPF